MTWGSHCSSVSDRCVYRQSNWQYIYNITSTCARNHLKCSALKYYVSFRADAGINAALIAEVPFKNKPRRRGHSNQVAIDNTCAIIPSADFNGHNNSERQRERPVRVVQFNQQRPLRTETRK